MYISREIKFLRYISIVHFLVIISSIYLTFLGKNELYYYSELYYGFVKYSLIFIIIYILVPLLLLIFPKIYRKNIKILKILKIICLAFVFISFLIGLLINISIWKTSTKAKSFISYCPYHFTLSLLNSIIQIKSDKNKFCKVRACFLYSEEEDNSLGYNYICNYNSYKDFKYKNNGKIYKRINSEGKEISSNFFIKCNKIANLSVSGEDIFQYFNICSQNNYYECMLFEKPKKKDYTSVNNKDSCPGKNYSNTAYLIGISSILIDIICFFFVFFAEYLIIRKITNIIQLSQTNQKQDQATINSTINKNEQQNDNNNNQEFKREPTEIIIVASPDNHKDELIITLDRRNNERYDKNSVVENANTNLSNEKQQKIINLKSKSSNTKLLNFNFFESDPIDIDNNNEINLNQKNENRDNKKIATNQETIFKNA